MDLLGDTYFGAESYLVEAVGVQLRLAFAQQAQDLKKYAESQ